MQYIQTKENVRYTHYDNVKAVLDEPLTNESNQSHYNRTLGGCSGDSPRTWFGDSSYSTGRDCLEPLARGWPKGLARADEELGKINLPRLPSVKRKRIRKDFGDELDVHRSMMGQHDKAWGTTMRTRKKANAGGRITLFYNMGINAGQHSDELFWRGALAAKLIDALEETGRRVQLLVYATTRSWSENGGTPDIVTSVVVKQYNQTMAIDKVMATTAFAAFWRVIGFKMILLQPETCCGSLGHTTGVRHRPIFDVGPNDVQIRISDDVTDKSSMLVEMEKILEPFK